MDGSTLGVELPVCQPRPGADSRAYILGEAASLITSFILKLCESYGVDFVVKTIGFCATLASM